MSVLFELTHKPADYEGQQKEFRGLKKWVKTLIGSLAALAVIYSVSRVGDYVYNRSCEVAGQKMGRDYRFTHWSGCYLQGDDGKFYPKESIREQ